MPCRWSIVTCTLMLPLIGGRVSAKPDDCLWDASFSVPGVNGEIRGSAVFDDGTGPALYVGGPFSGAGGVTARRIAKWDGVEWAGVGGGVSAGISAMCVADLGAGPALYLAGAFTTAGDQVVNHIAKWDGQSWSALGTGLGGPFPSPNALAAFDDGTGPALYVGGNFTEAGGVPVNWIARWDGTSWSKLGRGLGGPTCYSLCAYDDGSGPALYVGGTFEWVGRNVPARGIARWDGQEWSGVGGGLGGGDNSGVNALAVHDDGSGPALYVAGGFTTAGIVPVRNIARWDGVTWSDVGGGFDAGIGAIASFDAGDGLALYASVAFIGIGGGVTKAPLALWDGSAWSELGESVALSQGCCAVARNVIGFHGPDGDWVYFGGRFDTVDGQPGLNIARWGCEPRPAVGPGDLNCDGSVNQFDINPFITALSNVEHYRALYPACDPTRADLDANGTINPFDIQPFVDALTP